MMKYISISMIFIFLVACINNSTTVEEPTETDTPAAVEKADTKDVKGTNLDIIETKEDPIEDIRQKFAAITTARDNGELTMDSIAYECPDYPNYGIVYYYKKDGKVRLIRHLSDDGSHGGGSIEYYLWDSELFFQFVDESYWTFGNGGTVNGDDFQPNTVDYFTEMRYYFKDNELIKCLEKKFEHSTANKNNPKSNEVSNKEVECKSSEELLMPFYILRDLHDKGLKDKDCIWELDEE